MSDEPAKDRDWMWKFMHGTGLWGERKPDEPYHLAIGGAMCLCSTDGAAFVAVIANDGNAVHDRTAEERMPPCGLISRQATALRVRLDVLRRWAGGPQEFLYAFDDEGCGPIPVDPAREGEIGGVRVDRNRLAHVLQGFKGEAATVWTQGPLDAVMVANESAVAILMPRTAVVFEDQEQSIAEKLDAQRAHEAGLTS